MKRTNVIGYIKGFLKKDSVNKLDLHNEEMIKPAKEIRDYVEGIFNVHSEYDGYISEKKYVTEANVIGIEQKELNYSTTALFANNQKKYSGVLLELKNTHGTEKVKLPIEISLSDQDALLNKDTLVRYSKKVWSTPMEGTSKKHSLEVLSGTLQGKKLEKEVFV